MIIIKKEIVTIDIFYYQPDYQSLIQQFIWQTEDQLPQLSRIHRFLWFWKHNIDAVIKEIHLSVNEKGHSSYRGIDDFLNLT
jgi:uncharacterized protein Usg